jgi:hypothetical protein
MSEGKQHTRKRKKAKLGRPSVEWSPEVLDMMEQYTGCATVTDICRYLGISNTIYYRWFKKDSNPDFYEAVMRAKDRADDDVVEGFYKRAKGYTVELNKQKIDKDGCVHDTTEEVLVQPDAGAALNWLKNRRRDEWSDTKKVELTGDHVEMVEKLAKQYEEERNGKP